MDSQPTMPSLSSSPYPRDSIPVDGMLFKRQDDSSDSDDGGGNSPGDVINSVLDAYNKRLGSVAATAVTTQLGLMAGLAALTLLCFSILRPKNRLIYAPKAKYSRESKKPPVVGNGLFSWVPAVFKAREPLLMSTIGFDAVVFLRFLRMCRWMFTCIALVTCLLLVPIDIVKSRRPDKNFLTDATIQFIPNDMVYAHIAADYLVTLIVVFFLWRNYRTIVTLKWQWFRSDEYQNSLHARSLMVTQVPKKLQSDEGLVQMLNQLQIPYPTTAVHIGRRYGNLPEITEAHNDYVRKLESVLTTYLKNPNKLPSKRPTMRVNATFGFIGGQKVDAIDYLTNRIRELQERIEISRERIQDKKPENYGFTSFSTVPYAHVVAKKLYGKRLKGTHFELAPHPYDIIWESLSWTDGQRARSNFIGGVFLVIVFVLYTIPLVAVALLANLSAVTQYAGFLENWVTASKATFSIFVGTIPPLLSVILQLILPIIIRWIAKGQGSTTHSRLDRKVLSRYAGFLLISQFGVFTLLSVFYNLISEVVTEIGHHESFSEIYKAIRKLPSKVLTTYIQQSNYWMTWFPIRGFSAVFDLARVLDLIWVSVRKHMWGRTPREIREWTRPKEFDYPVYYANSILMIAVGFVYAPLAPLVTIFAAGAFYASSLIYKYQLMFVFVSRTETGGRLWRVVFNRVLICLLLMQGMMVLTVGLRKGWINCLVAVPPILATLIFKIYVARTFDPKFTWYIPNQEELATAVIHHSDARKNRLQRRFGHPCLHEELFTPQIHKKSEHLLPQVYSGKLSNTKEQINGKMVESAQIGGLTFSAMQEHDLEYDQMAYFRDRQDEWETGSMASTTLDTLGNPKANMSAAQRAAYLEHGPQSSIVGGRPFKKGDGNESKEQLIGAAAFANPPYDMTPPQMPYGYPPSRPESPSSYPVAFPSRGGSPYQHRSGQPSASSLDISSGYFPPSYPHQRVDSTGSSPGGVLRPPLPPGAGVQGGNSMYHSRDVSTVSLMNNPNTATAAAAAAGLPPTAPQGRHPMQQRSSDWSRGPNGSTPPEGTHQQQRSGDWGRGGHGQSQTQRSGDWGRQRQQQPGHPNQQRSGDWRR